MIGLRAAAPDLSFPRSLERGPVARRDSGRNCHALLLDQRLQGHADRVELDPVRQGHGIQAHLVVHRQHHGGFAGGVAGGFGEDQEVRAELGDFQRAIGEAQLDGDASGVAGGG